MRTTRLQRGLDRLSLYLPVLLMGLLAMGSWWLASTTIQPQTTTRLEASPHMPDYQLRGFRTQAFDSQSGTWRNTLSGASAMHYPQNDRIDLTQVQGRGINHQGQITTFSATRGRSQNGASEIELWGQAQIQRYSADAVKQDNSESTPQLRLESEYLHLLPNQERIQTHLPAVVTQWQKDKKNKSIKINKLSGNSLTYDHTVQVLEIHGSTRALLE